MAHRAKLIDAASSPVTGGPLPLKTDALTFHVIVTGSGAVSVVGRIQVSNDHDLSEDTWIKMADFDASGTDVAVDSKVCEAPWSFIRAIIDSVTGTVTVVLGARRVG